MSTFSNLYQLYTDVITQDAHKWFKGPKITIDLDILTDEQIKGLKKEGLDTDGLTGHSSDVGLGETGKEALHQGT